MSGSTVLRFFGGNRMAASVFWVGNRMPNGVVVN